MCRPFPIDFIFIPRNLLLLFYPAFGKADNLLTIRAEHKGWGYAGIYKHFSASALWTERVAQIGALAQQYGFTVRVREGE